MSDPLDLITLAEAKAALNIPTGDTGHDTEIAGYITAVSRRLDGLCGPVVKRTVTSESHDGGCYTILLDKYPTFSVEAVTEYDGTTATVLTAETNTLKPANAYQFTQRLGRLRRRAGNWPALFAYGAQNVEVTYTAGRYTTASVSANFKEAAAIMLSTLWRKEQGAGTQTFGATDGSTTREGLARVIPSLSIPQAALELLADEMLPPSV